MSKKRLAKGCVIPVTQPMYGHIYYNVYSPMEQGLQHVPVARVHLFRVLFDEAGKRPRVALRPDEFVEQTDRRPAAVADHRRVTPRRR